MHCNETASTLHFNMNLNVDPCEDFYEFACGNFVRNTRIADENGYVMLLNSYSSIIYQNLRTILEEPVTNDIAPFVLMKKLYFACMNESKLNVIIK